MFMRLNILLSWEYTFKNTIWLQEKLQDTMLFDSYDRWNLDKGVSSGTLLTNLSKDFDGIVHDFLISKLEAYGFIYEALNVRKNYL